MALLLSCQNLSKSFGSRLLFKEISFGIEENDRIALIGPNGSGKTTLLKIIAQKESPDSGILAPKRGLKIGYLPQECEFPDIEPEALLFKAIESWDESEPLKENRVKMWLERFGFKGNEKSAAKLSGGWKKRLALCLEMILSPDLLLLDEPTNHLDLESILWLESFLKKEAPSYLFVSHDRLFLQNMASRVIEIDPVYPKGMFSIEGPFAKFLEAKEQFLEGQLSQEKALKGKARRETEWLRQGVKARTTKSQSRIDDANELLEEHKNVKTRNQQRRALVEFSASERETRKLLSAKNIGKQIEGRTLFQNLDFVLSPGTRIGIMGPNGSGKTTLLKILAGELAPDIGTIKKADDLKIVYFDQHRAQLPRDLSLKDALSPNGDYVDYQGRPIHVNGWCKRFLFSPDLLPLPISKLSGGERARISIARLMLQPADILLLDEPTNDLDIQTLETLEESLIEFPGAVVLITHDRFLLERISNSLLALGSDTPQFFASYPQWEASIQKPEKSEPIPKKTPVTYLEKKELLSIERQIEKKEEEVKKLHLSLEDPSISVDSDKLSGICGQIAILEAQIEQLYLKWAELSK